MHFASVTVAFALSLRHMKLILASELLVTIPFAWCALPLDLSHYSGLSSNVISKRTLLITLSMINSHLTPSPYIILFYCHWSIY